MLKTNELKLALVRFVEKVMVAGMDEVLNSGLNANHLERIPVEVDVEIVESWGS
jgi:hypothetical protein